MSCKILHILHIISLTYPNSPKNNKIRIIMKGGVSVIYQRVAHQRGVMDQYMFGDPCLATDLPSSFQPINNNNKAIIH